MNQNYNKIPCFVEMKIKTTNKIYGISKQNLWFSIISTYSSSYSSQNCVFINVSLFPKPHPLGNPKSPRHDSKPTRIQIQTNKVT
jgi:hypothetical protein